MGIVSTFDIDRPFVARQAFTFAGRAFAPGDSFPWREVGTERDVRTLWRAMRVVNGAPATDALGGFEVLARIGAAFAVPPPPPPAPPPAKAKPKRASAEA